MCNGNRVCFRWRTCSSRINFHPDDRCSFTFLRISQVVRLAKRKEEDKTSFPETGCHDKNKLPARPFWSFLHISLSYITLREERERTKSIRTGLQIGTAAGFFLRKDGDTPRLLLQEILLQRKGISEISITSFQ